MTNYCHNTHSIYSVTAKKKEYLYKQLVKRHYKNTV